VAVGAALAAIVPPPERISWRRGMNQLTHPLHKIVATMAFSDTDLVAAVPDEAGFALDRIEIITAEEIKGPSRPFGGSRLRRLVVRLHLSLGDDLDELERARHELVHGHALVQMRVYGDEEQVRVHAILRQHGGLVLHYFGRWTITPIDHR
jgi:hypothetical protein